MENQLWKIVQKRNSSTSYAKLSGEKRTEKSYIHWIKRYIFFHNKRHPMEMSNAEVEKFLTYLAVEKHVSASTQNQAFSALLFLY